MASLYVEILQIPCKPSGDCSLHLLIEDVNGTKQLRKAVMVDGGKFKKDCDYITPVLKKARDRFRGKPEQDFRLDALVITHWDRDHYEASENFWSDPANRQAYLKYSQYGAGNDKDGNRIPAQNATLETRLYCPNIDDKSDAYLRTVAGISDMAVKPKVEWITAQTDLSELVGPASKAVPKNILGVDFFTGKYFCEYGSEDIYEKLRAAKEPCFVCIGANGWTFTHDGLFPCPVPNENARSVAAVLAGVTPPPNDKDSWHRLSYYCAGDANNECESVFAVNFAAVRTRVDTMKATHHASFKNFNHALFECFRPRNYVISAGTEHGHPSIALLFELFKYSLKRRIGVHTSCFPYWIEKHKGKRWLNLSEFLSVINDISPWVAALQDKKKGNYSRVKADNLPSNSWLQSLGNHLKELRNDIEKKTSASVATADGKNIDLEKLKKEQEISKKAKKEDIALTADENELVVNILKQVYEWLSETDVTKEAKKMEKSAKGKGIDNQAFLVTMTFKPKEDPAIIREPLKAS